MHGDKETNFSKYINIFSDISTEFNQKFQDFQLIQNDLKVLSNPFTAEAEKAPAKLQLDSELKDYFLLSQNVENTWEFWKFVPSNLYHNLCDFSFWMLSMFSSTYVCERMFSHMNKIKSKEKMDCRMKV